MKKWNIGNLWKKYKYVGLVVLAGLALMLLPGKKTDAQTQEGGGSFSLEDTERRMEELLGRMDGVGRVQVMLTLKNSSALELAEGAVSGRLTAELLGGDVRTADSVREGEVMVFRFREAELNWRQELAYQRAETSWRAALASAPYTLTLWDRNGVLISETKGTMGSIWR